MAEFKQSPFEIVHEGKPIGIPYILYRPHRGGLAESMAEMKIFHSLDEFRDHIVKNHWCKIYPENVVVDYKSHVDERIGWFDVHYVLADYKFRTGKLAQLDVPEVSVIGMVDLQHWKEK